MALSKKWLGEQSGLILGARAPSPAPRWQMIKKVQCDNHFALRAHSGRGRPRSQY